MKLIISFKIILLFYILVFKTVTYLHFNTILPLNFFNKTLSVELTPIPKPLIYDNKVFC